MNDFRSEKGQGLVEYALILILVAIVVILAVTALGTTTKSMFSDINNNISMISNFV
jgi:pilus assembly protein Flp/PilA